MRDRFNSLVTGTFGLGISNNELTKFVLAQAQPVSPGALRLRRAAFHISHVLPLHRVRLQLIDEVLPRGRIHRHAKDTARVLVETVDRQWHKATIGGWQ